MIAPVQLRHRAPNTARRRRQQQRAARDNEFFYYVDDFDPGENYPHTEPQDYSYDDYYYLSFQCPNCDAAGKVYVQRKLLKPKTMICPNCLTRQKFTLRREE